MQHAHHLDNKKPPDVPAVFWSWEDFSKMRSVAAQKLSADGLTGDGADVLTSDAEVGEFAVRHAAEFRDGLAILHPVVVSACEVHDRFLSCRHRSG